MLRNKINWVGAALAAVILLALGACAPEMVPPPDATAAIPSLEVQPVQPTEKPSTTKLTPGFDIDPRSTPAPGTLVPTIRPGGITVDNLPVFEPVRAYIIQTLGISEDELVLISYEPVDWPDSCLGVAQRGTACAQVITPGYLLFFDTPQGRIEAHLDKSGRIFRLVPSLEPVFKGLPTHPPGTPGASGILGQVLVGPACPGPVSADNPCPDQPMQATISVLGENGEAVMQFQSDSGGFFQVELPPGRYVLLPESPGKLPIGIEQEVVVLAGQYLEIQIHYDNGIR